jgi:signal transduction histidine kinase
MSTAGVQTQSVPVVILWTPVGRDAALAGEALQRASIPSTPYTSIEDVCAAVSSEHAGLAILAEEALSSASIEQLQKTLENQPSWSDLPLLLLTGGGNSTSASLNRLRKMRVLGNITLLERPLRSVTLVAAVQSALASRRRQFQTRDQILQLQEAQEKLAQANADLKQFAFAASHDLQEPLRMVNVFTQLLLERHVDTTNEDARQFGEYVHRGVKRMELLLRDLLLYSRAIHEERTWPRSHFDLNFAISDAISSLHMEIHTTQARIISGAMPIVQGDQTQLSLVFQNLISNAIKYAKEGVPPVIRISAEKAEGAPLIRVKDNGIGFNQKYAERVFDLFQRLGDSKVPGTGLGLAICRRIIERNGGRIWAESEPGIGSTFLFSLPGAEAAE